MGWLKRSAKTLPFWCVVLLLVAFIPPLSMLAGTAALVLFIVALVGLIRKKRKIGSVVIVLILAFFTMAIAGGTLQDTDALEAHPQTVQSQSATPSASPTVSASPTKSATPTPSKTTSSPKPTLTTPVAKPTPNKTVDAENDSALAVAQQLTVKGRAPKTGYDRDEFGQRWADTDRNGCDQRNDILRRDLTNYTIRAGSNGCVVMTGTLVDPFSAETIAFQRGESTSSLVQIDHVVPLSDAWQKGAQQMSASEREAFANDFLNLLAVKGSLNSQKSDSDAASWLPPNKSYRCDYVARQVAVKHKYGIWVTQAEQDTFVRLLSSCPDQKLPTSGSVPVDYNAPVTEEQSKPQPQPAPQKTVPVQQAPAQQPSNVYYENCKHVWESIGGPIYQGDPGFQDKFDGDSDGVGCENPPRY